MTLAKGEVVKRWHPKFVLDAVEDIPAAEIQMPSGAEENVPQVGSSCDKTDSISL